MRVQRHKVIFTSGKKKFHSSKNEIYREEDKVAEIETLNVSLNFVTVRDMFAKRTLLSNAKGRKNELLIL